MSLNFYKHIDNWHKHPWISKLLCKIGRHNYEFMWMDGDSGILQCFYCSQKCRSHTDLGNCKYCGGKLGKNWICYDYNCKEKRREKIKRAIGEAEAQELYEISEHLTSKINL
jgi:hypothetical protein